MSIKRHIFEPGNMARYDLLFGRVPKLPPGPDWKNGETLTAQALFSQGSTDDDGEGGYLLVWLSSGGSGGGAFRFDHGGFIHSGYLMEKMSIKLRGDAYAMCAFLNRQGFNAEDGGNFNEEGEYNARAFVKECMDDDKPEEGKVYRLTGGPNDTSIAQGDSWSKSVVEEEGGE